MHIHQTSRAMLRWSYDEAVPLISCHETKLRPTVLLFWVVAVEGQVVACGVYVLLAARNLLSASLYRDRARYVRARQSMERARFCEELFHWLCRDPSLKCNQQCVPEEGQYRGQASFNLLVVSSRNITRIARRASKLLAVDTPATACTYWD